MTDKYHCQYCLITFSTKTNKTKHEKKRPESCYDREKLINDKIQDDLKLQKEQHERQLQELKTKIALNASSSNKVRKKLRANMNAKKLKVPNFYNIIPNAKMSYTYLFGEINKTGSGLDNIFKKYYFERYTPKQYCIKTYDIAREQYGVFNGNKWERVSLSYIIDTFLSQLQPFLYDIVIKKKIEMLDSLDKKYTPYFVALFDESPDRDEHNKKTQEICDKYHHATWLNSTIISCNDTYFMKTVHERIKTCISRVLS